jgi:hypothetical protein
MKASGGLRYLLDFGIAYEWGGVMNTPHPAKPEVGDGGMTPRVTPV